MNKMLSECGGYAFPDSCSNGMTLRDWMAGQALSGYISTWTDSAVKPEYIAATAYRIADAMLKERGEIDD